MILELSEEEKKKQLKQDSPESTEIGAGSGLIQASKSGLPASSSRLSPTLQSTPQNFGTIQDYFKRNVQQGERFGGQITGKLGEAFDQGQQTIDKSATGALKDIKESTISSDFAQDIPDEWPIGVFSPEDQAASRAGLYFDPTKIADDPDLFESFSKQWNASYGGPESFEASDYYGGAATAAQKGAGLATQLGTTGGRQQYIQDEFGVYGQGNKGLDEGLLQQSSYFPEVGEKAEDLGSLQDYLASHATDIGEAATAAKTETDLTKTQTRALFEGSLTAFSKSLLDSTDKASQTAGKVLEKYGPDLPFVSAKDLSDDLKATGVDAQTITNITKTMAGLKQDYDINPEIPGHYMGTAANIDSATVATREDYDVADALQKLTGVDYSGVLNPADIDKAGTFSGPTPDPQGLQTYLSEKLTTEDNAFLSEPREQPKTAEEAIKTYPTLTDKYIRVLTRKDYRPTNPQELGELGRGLHLIYMDSIRIVRDYDRFSDANPDTAKYVAVAKKVISDTDAFFSRNAGKQNWGSFS